jgi:hypothetical protein
MILEHRKRNGGIVDWQFEAIRLKVGDGKVDAWYTPDFFVTGQDAFTIIEVKGHRERAGVVRFKAAMRQYPYFQWQMVQKVKGVWQVVETNG